METGPICQRQQSAIALQQKTLKEELFHLCKTVLLMDSLVKLVTIIVEPSVLIHRKLL